MIKYSYIELDNKNKLEKIIYNNEIEVNNINECSIKLKVILFENKTYLIFNFLHIYNKKNAIEIIITLKEKGKPIDLEKLRNDFYANFN